MTLRGYSGETMPTLNPEEDEGLDDPYRIGSAGEGSAGFPNRPGLQRVVGRRYRSGRELAASTRRYIGRVAERQRQRDQARDQKEFAVAAINERAGREVVNRRSSPADIDKAIDSGDGTGLEARTPGIDAYKARNRYAGGTSVRPDQMRHAVSQVAGEIMGNRAAKPSSTKPAPSVQDRVNSIAQTLKPGEYVGVKEGNSAAMSEKQSDGTFSTHSVTLPGKIAAGPGRVRDESGKMVPIGEETARMAATRKPGLDAADRAATETAAAYNRNRDSNPAVALAQKVDAYQRSRQVSPSSSAAPASVVAGATQPPADQDPYRRKLIAGR